MSGTRLLLTQAPRPEPVSLVDTILTTFIQALRNADVRISTAETLDALHAVDLVGYRNRQLLKDSLALVLPKTHAEKAAYELCFDQFFSFRDNGALEPPADDAAPDESQESGSAAGDASAGGGGEERSDDRSQHTSQATATAQPQPVATQDTTSREMSAPQSSLGQLLTRGNSLEIAAAIAAAGRAVNVQAIELFTQKGVYTRRILESMGLQDLQQEVHAMQASTTLPDRRLAQDLVRRRDWLQARVRDHVEREFLLHADVTGRRLREELVRDMRLSTLDQRHHRLIQELVLRMARRLIAAYSRRRKVVSRGRLHVPRTLRRNMKYDDAIMELHWKSELVDRPKVFAACDLSGSVASYAGFMLTFLYSLDAVLPKVRSFAFSSDLGEVTDLFRRYPIEDALALALKRYGSGSTDYGQAFMDLRRLCMEDIDRRTTIIVLGDARSNYGDTRTDVLKEIYERCRRLIWLNPEPRSIWNTGDSEMRHVSPYCHQLEECGTLAQLERFVSRLVRATS